MRGCLWNSFESCYGYDGDGYKGGGGKRWIVRRLLPTSWVCFGGWSFFLEKGDEVCARVGVDSGCLMALGIC